MKKYYVLYKPYLVMSQFSPMEGKETLADYCKVAKDVYPVGRLDYDSEGLILLTNDGSLNQALLHPSKAHLRTYWVQVDGAISNAAIQQLQKGVPINIDGKQYQTKPCQASILTSEPMLPPRTPPIRFRKSIPTTWISLTLTEGKNRQVRKMTAQVGYPTLRLVRYSIGQLTIDGMASGELQEINKEILVQKVLGKW